MMHCALLFVSDYLSTQNSTLLNLVVLSLHQLFLYSLSTALQSCAFITGKFACWSVLL